MTGKNNALESHIGNLRGNLETIEAEKAQIVAERAAMGDQLWALNNNLQSSHIKAEELNEKVSALNANLRAILVEKGQIENQNAALRSKVGKLESTMEEDALQHQKKCLGTSIKMSFRAVHLISGINFCQTGSA